MSIMLLSGIGPIWTPEAYGSLLILRQSLQNFPFQRLSVSLVFLHTLLNILSIQSYDFFFIFILDFYFVFHSLHFFFSALVVLVMQYTSYIVSTIYSVYLYYVRFYSIIKLILLWFSLLELHSSIDSFLYFCKEFLYIHYTKHGNYQ